MSGTCPFCSASIEAGTSQCPYCGGLIDATLAAGERLGGRFQIVELMGAGPLGATYRARDLHRNHDLALEVIADELVPNDAERAGFISRIEMFAGRTIAGCAMPLVVGADARAAFVAVPLVEGVTLRAILGARSAARAPLGPEEALRILLALSASLSALHSATPHGALGPDTILVTARGLLLTDCAIAVAAVAERLQPRLQRFARAVPYVSPEVGRGKRITAVADLFALGVIAAELLTGSPSVRSLENAPLDPTILAPLRNLVDRDPSKRPGASGALLDALSRVAGFPRRPAQPPLLVPEVPSAPRTSVVPTADISALATAAAPPLSRPSRDADVTAHGRRVSAPPAAPEDPPGPGRLGPSTASLPAIRGGPGFSGPPGGIASARSGPPPESRHPAGAIPPLSKGPPGTPGSPGAASLPSTGRAPKVPSISKAAAPAPPEPTGEPPQERRSLDDIDPRLLRAARRLEAERRTADGDEVDVGEIELVDD